jgi:hypothetical protein
MDFAAELTARLISAKSFGYHRDSQSAVEPTTLAAIALLGTEQAKSSLPLLQWLLERQNGDGSLGVDTADTAPCWPTAWAIIAWHHAQSSELNAARFASARDKALEWLVTAQGETIAHEDTKGTTGHDTMILGWSWVKGTHAWLEPTAMALLALKLTGHDDHVRAREAVDLLHDRLLPKGGSNYGNTIVFNQELRPHVQPTGLALLALGGERHPDDRVAKSIDYLRGELSARTPTASLSYGLLGLAAQNAYPADAESWLSAAAQRTLSRDPAPYKLALLLLASRGVACPLVPATEVVP